MRLLGEGGADHPNPAVDVALARTDDHTLTVFIRMAIGSVENFAEVAVDLEPQEILLAEMTN